MQVSCVLFANKCVSSQKVFCFYELLERKNVKRNESLENVKSGNKTTGKYKRQDDKHSSELEKLIVT